jgi:hypothetical protein
MEVRNRGTGSWVISRVSSEAMLLRLRSARLWENELSVWRLMTGGGFSYIGWLAVGALNGKAQSHTYFEMHGIQGGRRGESILALWSRPSNFRVRPSMPLFEQTRKS